jgi:hypothetical protein
MLKNRRVIIHYGPEGKRHPVREIKASGRYLSFDAPRAHFGLGAYDALQKMEVRWSDGTTTVIAHSFPPTGNTSCAEGLRET